MAAVMPSPAPDVARRILRLQAFTLVWMSAEAAVSLGAAWAAHSPALVAFGGDSAIELLSAAVVFWRFRRQADASEAEERAARIAGWLLLALAAFVAVASTLALLGYRQARPSLAGIALLATAAAVMPWLASRKRKLAAVTSSASLKADAAESALCGYLAWIALAGLAVNAIWGKSWADPAAALALIPLILREGWEAIRHSRLGCQCSPR
jgi:divalent metal cation (Fe/Co/Zn/Cd) transporter